MVAEPHWRAVELAVGPRLEGAGDGGREGRGEFSFELDDEPLPIVEASPVSDVDKVVAIERVVDPMSDVDPEVVVERAAVVVVEKAALVDEDDKAETAELGDAAAEVIIV